MRNLRVVLLAVANLARKPGKTAVSFYGAVGKIRHEGADKRIIPAGSIHIDFMRAALSGNTVALVCQRGNILGSE